MKLILMSLLIFCTGVARASDTAALYDIATRNPQLSVYQAFCEVLMADKAYNGPGAIYRKVCTEDWNAGDFDNNRTYQRGDRGPASAESRADKIDQLKNSLFEISMRAGDRPGKGKESEEFCVQLDRLEKLIGPEETIKFTAKWWPRNQVDYCY